MRTGQVAGGAHEGVIVEDVKDAGHRLNDVVFAQFGVATLAGALVPRRLRSRNRRPRRPCRPSPSSSCGSSRRGPADRREFWILVAAAVLAAVVILVVLLGLLAAVGLAGAVRPRGCRSSRGRPRRCRGGGARFAGSAAPFAAGRLGRRTVLVALGGRRFGVSVLSSSLLSDLPLSSVDLVPLAGAPLACPRTSLIAAISSFLRIPDVP